MAAAFLCVVLFNAESSQAQFAAFINFPQLSDTLQKVNQTLFEEVMQQDGFQKTSPLGTKDSPAPSCLQILELVSPKCRSC